ncbi:MAG TPA: hypothetical protein DCE71_04175 [Parachlamydiales bacterium]|nr:hypothetical protein [Parachlamydiales bacterium]
MSVELQSRELYKVSIQAGYDLYSSSAPALGNSLSQMDSCKGQWARGLTDLSVSTVSASEKETIAYEALSNYHKFMKTREFAAQLFETLQSIYEDCKRPSINPETYVTMTRLGGNAEELLKQEEALATICKHVKQLAERTRLVFKEPIETRLPQIASPLNSLLSAIRPELSNWSWSLWGTPVLDATYQEWLSNASDESKNWALPLSKNTVGSASFETPAITMMKLHEALQTLNLTYIDPQTKLGYGIAPKGSTEAAYSEIQHIFDEIKEKEGTPAFQNIIAPKSEPSEKTFLTDEETSEAMTLLKTDEKAEEKVISKTEEKEEETTHKADEIPA